MISAKRFLILLLALLLVIFSLLACKGDTDEPEDPNTDDEFSGSIAGDPENNTGSGTESAPPPLEVGDPNATVEIRTADDLKKIAQNGTYILMNDIDMTNIGFAPIGNYQYPFKGTFKSSDGECFAIKNLKTSVNTSTVGPTPTYTYVYAGFFGATKDATISNIIIENVEISASSSDENCFVTAGAIAGYTINTTVSDCSTSGSIISHSKLFNAYAGGICGILEGGTVNNCITNLALEVKDSKNRAVTGGIAALALISPSVSNCVVKGSVKSVTNGGVAYAGGIVGNTRKASYTVCRSEATVYSEALELSATEALATAAYAGGIAAVSSAQNETEKTSFTRCYAIDRSVTAVGNDSAAYAGGIAGYITYTDFTHCYSLCDVTLKARAKTSFASSGFAYIATSASDTSAENYVADFNIKGCFVYGDLIVEHGRSTHLLLGTLYAHISNESSKSNVKTSFYNLNAVYSLNGDENPKTLSKNGSSRGSTYFTEADINQFGWTASEWETVDGYLYAK